MSDFPVNASPSSRTLGIGLGQGPRGVRFFVSKVPLWLA